MQYIKIKPTARKFIDKLDNKLRVRVCRAIEKLYPTPTGDIKILKGTDRKIYRLRVGSVRVLFYYGKCDNNIILYIDGVYYRKDAYKK